MAFNQTRTFGVEIEFVALGMDQQTIVSRLTTGGLDVFFAGYTHRITSGWKLVTDASVPGGFELVSPILKGDAGLANLKLAANLLDGMGMKVNKRCGLHVHHDVNDVAASGVINLFKSYAKSESAIDGMLPPSRRGTGAQHVRTLAHNRAEINRATTMNELRSAVGTRYKKLNVESYWKYGTVEFRHHSGSLDFEKIGNWVKLTQAMVEKSVSGLFGSTDFYTMLENLKGGTGNGKRFGTRGINKLCREYFERGETDDNVIYAALRREYPESVAVPHRVANNRKKWMKSLGGGGLEESVVEYAKARFGHFNPNVETAVAA